MQNLFKDIIGNILTTIKNTLVFLAEHLGKENGIRSLFMVVLLIPSICLLWLYNEERNYSDDLEAKVVTLELKANEAEAKAHTNYLLYATAKDSLRKTIIDEYVHLSKEMNKLKSILDDSNDTKAKAIIKQSNNVDKEINKIE